MHQNRLTHINKSSDAIGARVKTETGYFGYIESTKNKKDIWCNEYNVRLDDGSITKVTTREFEIIVELVHGAKYMTMAGDIRTVFELRNDFYFDYEELGGFNAYEYIYPNGSTAHYDCGANILKRVKDYELPRRAKR